MPSAEQVAGLMGINAAVLMRKLLPAALLAVVRGGDLAALQAACAHAKMSEQELLRDYGHFATAQLLWEGASSRLCSPPCIQHV